MKVHFKRLVMGSFAFLFLMAPLGLCAVFGSKSMTDVNTEFYTSCYRSSQLPFELREQLRDVTYWKSQTEKFGSLEKLEQRYKDDIKRDFPLRKRVLETKLKDIETSYDGFRFGKLRFYAALYRPELIKAGIAASCLGLGAIAHAKGYDRSAWNHTYGALPESLQNGLEQAAKRVCRFFVYGSRNVINKTVEVGGRVQNALAENE